MHRELASIAWAQSVTGGGSGGGNVLVSLIPFLLIFVLFYFLLILPQQKRQKKAKEMLEALKKGDKVVTASGREGENMKAVFVIAGAAVGLLIVRSFMLDSIEEIAWRLFWDQLFKGNIGTRGMEQVAQSATFTKCVIGMATGGVLGYAAATQITTTTRGK